MSVYYLCLWKALHISIDFQIFTILKGSSSERLKSNYLLILETKTVCPTTNSLSTPLIVYIRIQTDWQKKFEERHFEN